MPASSATLGATHLVACLAESRPGLTTTSVRRSVEARTKPCSVDSFIMRFITRVVVVVVFRSLVAFSFLYILCGGMERVMHILTFSPHGATFSSLRSPCSSDASSGLILCLRVSPVTPTHHRSCCSFVSGQDETHAPGPWACLEHAELQLGDRPQARSDIVVCPVAFVARSRWSNANKRHGVISTCDLHSLACWENI